MKFKISTFDYYFTDKNVLSGKNILLGGEIIIFFINLHWIIMNFIFGGWNRRVSMMQFALVKLHK
jgi:hypothetical protein